MLAHTFRGSSSRSALGLEDARTVFARYKAIRRAERDYLPAAKPLGGGRPQAGWRQPVTTAAQERTSA